MTARSTDPVSMARAAKNKDTAPKPPRRSAKDDPTRNAAVRVYPNTSTNAGAASVSPDKPLTEKQKLFTKYWAQGESIPAAARKSGYGGDGVIAYRMVRQPNILALKAKYEEEYRASMEIDRRQVLEGFKEAIDMAKLLSDPGSMIAGWREIGKVCGYYAPVETKVKIDVTGDVTMRTLNQLSDAELLELIQNAPES